MAIRILLISTYEMGRQPFGIASPAAWLREAGHDVDCLDLSVQPLDERLAEAADLVGFYVPMHLATRLAVDALRRVRAVNASAHVCFFGLYAPVNADHLRTLGANWILGGEFESGLVAVARVVAAGRTPGPRVGRTGPARRSGLPTTGAGSASAPEGPPPISLERQRFRVPDRSGLPTLDRYAALVDGTGRRRTAGYTEASRGCKHTCRHCPIVPVYGGRFRVVQREIVLEDIRRQVDAGAGHITFGDPDFFNGPGHAIPIVEALHASHPELTYDVTIKVEHLIRHAEHLPTLAGTGCALVTTAVESFDDAVLTRLDKGHTRDDVETAVRLCREAGLAIAPTFVAFTPWTTLDSYLDFLREIARLGLIESVAPVQYAIRLLIPAGSRILELEEVARMARPLDGPALVHPWSHPDLRVDQLHRRLEPLVQRLATDANRAEAFRAVWEHACSAVGGDPATEPELPVLRHRVTVPYLTEPWYC